MATESDDKRRLLEMSESKQERSEDTEVQESVRTLYRNDAATLRRAAAALELVDRLGEALRMMRDATKFCDTLMTKEERASIDALLKEVGK